MMLLLASSVLIANNPEKLHVVCMYGRHINQSINQPGKVANPARGQLNRGKCIFPCPCTRLRIWSRETGLAVPSRVSLLILHTQAESGAYSLDFSRLPRRGVFKPPYAIIGSVPSLSGHAVAYRWRSLPSVHRHRASKPQGSSERVLSSQVTMDQSMCASLSRTYYWYEVGMLIYTVASPACGLLNRENKNKNRKSACCAGSAPHFPPRCSYGGKKKTEHKIQGAYNKYNKNNRWCEGHHVTHPHA